MKRTSNSLETPISLEEGFKILKHIDLKKLIFTYLNLEDQREVYWSNKAKLRPLLSNSALDINIKSFKVRSSLDMRDKEVYYLLELPDGNIACWIREEIILMKFKNSIFEEIRRIPYNTFNIEIKAIEHLIFINEKKHMIYSINFEIIQIWDVNFNYIQTISEPFRIQDFSNLSSSSFIVAISHEDHFSCLKAYILNNDINKYELFLLVEDEGSFRISCCLYSPKNDYLICGTQYGQIKVSRAFSTISAKNFSELFTDDLTESHKDYFKKDLIDITYLRSLNDDLFASTTYFDIYIWNYQNSQFICIGTISTPADYLNSLNGEETILTIERIGDDFIVGYYALGPDILIFNYKTYECVKIIRGQTNIRPLTVTQDNSLISTNFYEAEDLTTKYLLQMWKISE